jgi:hypothetical protein
LPSLPWLFAVEQELLHSLHALSLFRLATPLSRSFEPLYTPLGVSFLLPALFRCALPPHFSPPSAMLLRPRFPPRPSIFLSRTFTTSLHPLAPRRPKELPEEPRIVFDEEGREKRLFPKPLAPLGRDGRELKGGEGTLLVLMLSNGDVLMNLLSKQLGPSKSPPSNLLRNLEEPLRRRRKLQRRRRMEREMRQRE